MKQLIEANFLKVFKIANLFIELDLQQDNQDERIESTK